MQGNEQKFANHKENFRNEHNFANHKENFRNERISVDEKNYVDEAERVILALKKKDQWGKPLPMVTTSKLRNLLAVSADIYNEALNHGEDRLSENLCSRIEYLRVRFLYEAGRDPAVRSLIEEAGAVNQLKRIQASKKNFMLFHRYMEALVAFRKYHGGRDE